MPSLFPKYMIILLLMIPMVCIQCGDGLPDDPFANLPNALDVNESTGYSNLDVSTARNNVLSLPFERLSDLEEKGIRFVREEEKVAMDYYNTMYTLFSTDELINVALSEQTHFMVSGFVFNKYGLDDPTVGMDVGAFASQSLQAHYDELIKEGSPSLMAAYVTGAKLQEANLITIQNQLDRVANNRDLRTIYSALRIATRNHLRIMINGVIANGGVYDPLFLDAADFQEIIRSAFEAG